MDKDRAGGIDATVVEQLGQRFAELTGELTALRTSLGALAKLVDGGALVTSKEIAPVLGITHPKTVERWVRERSLPCVRIGRNLRFRLGDVLRWQAQQG